MIDLYINELKKYSNDDILIQEIIKFLLTFNDKLCDHQILFYEKFLLKIKFFYKEIENTEINKKRKSEILNILNEIIKYLNDLIISTICKDV